MKLYCIILLTLGGLNYFSFPSYFFFIHVYFVHDYIDVITSKDKWTWSRPPFDNNSLWGKNQSSCFFGKIDLAFREGWALSALASM